MKLKIWLSKGFFWIQSLILVVLAFYVLIILKDIKIFLLSIILAIIASPKILELWLNIKGENKECYIQGFKIEFSFLMLFIAFLLAYFFMAYLLKQDDVETFESLIRIIIYLGYLLVMFLHKKANKTTKYVVFGLFYLSCNILSFASHN